MRSSNQQILLISHGWTMHRRTVVGLKAHGRLSAKMKHLFSVNCYHVARQRQLKRPSSTLSEVPIGNLLSPKAINCLLMSGLILKIPQKQSCSNGTTEIGITAPFGVKTKLSPEGLAMTRLLTNRWGPYQQLASGSDLK